MEGLEKKQPERREADSVSLSVNPEQLPAINGVQKKGAGLAERLAGVKGRIAVALLAIGTQTLEAPATHVVEPIPQEVSGRIVAETLSTSVVEKIHEQGFDVRVTLPRPESTRHSSYYIIHFGQLHESTYVGLDRAMYKSVVEKHQRRMYALYPQLLSACNSPIFQEGRSYGLQDKTLAPLDDKKIQEALSNIEAISKSRPVSVTEAIDQLAIAERVGNMVKALRRHPQVQRLIHAETFLAGKLREFANSAEENDRNDERFREFNLRLRMLETSNNPLFAAAEGSDAQFQASSRLFFEGKADLVGLERAKENQDAMSLISVRNEAIDARGQMVKDARTLFRSTPGGKAMEALFAEIQTLSSADAEKRADEFSTRLRSLTESEKRFVQEHSYQTPEYQSLTASIDILNYKIQDIRETVVYEKVEEFVEQYPDYGGTGLKCAVIEYGKNHTFAESAQVWNARSNTHVSFGIIDVFDPKEK
ncbi:MAG: hypothetical protein UY59_C0020G0009 [Candidatus Kaiserbacteria bacterium GW2011_GWA1_50_28]|nr:MAG: hypothetical protein UY59_C0020G0009 [Candidatus Kaiserbacteria bacterium GW2011_GWA1_50_28]OGG86595.1 MAG: hypothetical protein A3H15_02715 [Candidatus Kaiserbacteria bacterium RIFCSPLOWO2_12_FULL_50_28]HCM43637.1 hypothetical protein [Candidatus Kaiserbacteria bacterium]